MDKNKFSNILLSLLNFIGKMLTCTDKSKTMRAIEEEEPEASIPRFDTVEPSNNAIMLDGMALLNEIQ